jgi:Stage II sporulation protein E (SpoIIE)
MLRATGDTLGGLRRSDAFDIVLDGRSRVTGLVVQDRSGDGAQRPLLDDVWRVARIALLGLAPLHELVAAVVAETARSEYAEIGLAMVRVSQTDSRVEVLNAGMPPIACATPTRTFLHPALSSAIGHRDARDHAYEVVPLIWGSTWLLGSPGLTSGSLAPEAVRTLCERLELGIMGIELAGSSPDVLRDRLLARHPEASGLASDDATLIVIGADPHARLLSIP